MARIKGYTRSDGTKVRGHTRTYKRKTKGKTQYERKYTQAQRRAHTKSRTSKSGHKTWRERQKQSKPGLWSNYWAKKKGK